MLKRLASINILFCLLSSITFASDPLIKQAHSGEIALDSSNLKKGVDIPLIFAPILNNKKLTAQTISVKRDSNIKSELRTSFKSSVNGTTLSVNFDPSGIPGPAKYELLIRFSSADTIVEDILFVIIVPEGVFKIPNPLNIKMTDYFLFSILKEPVPKLELKESGGLNGLENIPLGAVMMSGNDKEEFGLEFEKKLVSIPAGRSEFLRYHAIGNFPLGKFQETYLITAPGKSNQQSAVITVENSMTSLVILLLLILGIALGTFFRFYIGSRKNLAGLAVEADEILATLYEEKWKIGPDRIEDDLFREDLEAILKMLSEAKAAAKPKRLLLSASSVIIFKGVIEKSRAHLKNSQDKLAQRASVFEGHVRSLLVTLENSYFLPKTVTDELLLAHSEVQKLSDYFKTHNISGGEEKLDELLSNLVKRLEDLLKIYQENQWRFTNKPVSLLLPEEVATSLTASQVAMKDFPFTLLDIEADTQSLATRLDEWSANHLRWKTSVHVYINFYSVYFNRLYRGTSAIVDIENSHPTLKDLLDRYILLVSDPRTYTTQGNDVIYADAMEELDSLWQTVFSELAGQQPDPTIADAINVRNYLTALNLIKRLSPRSKPFPLRALDRPQLIEKDWNMQDWFVNLLSTANEKPTPYPLDPGKREFNRLPARRELETWTWIETAVSALFICVAGYAIFAPNFDGSPGNLIAIFFSGFSLDITAGSLQDYYKKLNP